MSEMTSPSLGHDDSVPLRYEERVFEGGPCMAWLVEQRGIKGGAQGDGLMFAQEFMDPRPDCGGWIRLGYDSGDRLCYSCNGEVRPPFRRVHFSLSGTEAYFHFPDISKGFVIPLTHHAAEVLIPSLRRTFDDARVSHNIPSDPELLDLVFSSTNPYPLSYAPPPRLPEREQDCNVHCSACSIM
eukprot:TRINITY_DN1979_c0_g1_i1.p1 TRINITY_DN1979_c0_g1~~TRINITY_DN1979_c0_g1_i1.p1  ORF type:complete len:198 (+),score=36.75 TRINITY_DN1979_c0_g1_i1:44-595(+)